MTKKQFEKKYKCIKWDKQTVIDWYLFPIPNDFTYLTASDTFFDEMNGEHGNWYSYWINNISFNQNNDDYTKYFENWYFQYKLNNLLND